MEQNMGENMGENMPKRKKKGVSVFVVIAAALVVAAVALIASSHTIIPTGYTGVRVTLGQVDEKPLSSGFCMKLPFIQEIEKVNNKQQDIVFNEQIWSETAQRTAIYYADVTVTYQISPEKSPWIFAHVANYRSNLVSQSLVASGIKATSKTLRDTDATNRAVIEPAAMENIQKALNEKYGQEVVIINKVVIGNADFDNSYNEAIAAKQKAELEAEQQQIENQKAIDKAKAEAEVLKTSAEAQAQAKVIAAQAEADANRLLEESLSDNILRDKYIDKWDGSLPMYVGGENGSVMVGMNGSDIVGRKDTEEK